MVTRTDLVDAHGAITIVTNYNYLHSITAARNTIKNPLSHVGIMANGSSAVVDVIASATDNTMLNTTGALKTPFSVGAYVTLTKSGNTLNGGPI